jgi:hypothetical protein
MANSPPSSTCCGGDGRACGHHGIDPDVVDVFPVRDGAGNVCRGDDAGRLAGPRIHDDESRGARVLHQVGGRGRVVVLLDRGERWPHDIGDGGCGWSPMKRGFLRGDACPDLLHLGLLTCRWR